MGATKNPNHPRSPLSRKKRRHEEAEERRNNPDLAARAEREAKYPGRS